MVDRLALKRLTDSDLTFFETLFRKLRVGNQKAINLNADVFVDQFYPVLGTGVGKLIPVSLSIWGPGGLDSYVISRAITKQTAAYKNWRLNGEFIRDPDDQPGRFDVLATGDIAVMEFFGDPLPQKVSLVLVSANSTIDAALHTALSSVVPTGRSMVRLPRDALADLAAEASATHPIRLMTNDPGFEAALEDAALGGVKGTDELASKKGVSAEVLAAAKASAEKNGKDGEALAWVYLQALKINGVFTEIKWISAENAIAPYDFHGVDAQSSKTRIDAKSTNGEFNQPLHMSSAELRAAADASHRYELWRVYKIGKEGAHLRRSDPVADVAKSILSGIQLPKGATVDCVSIDPTLFGWGKEIFVARPEEDE
jgi:hypothetical protein